jgi:hypothetical protein
MNRHESQGNGRKSLFQPAPAAALATMLLKKQKILALS